MRKQKEIIKTLECRNCKFAKEIKQITAFKGQKIALENQFYWIKCEKSGISETCSLKASKPLDCEIFNERVFNSTNG